MAADISFWEYANIYNFPEIKDYSDMKKSKWESKSLLQGCCQSI